MIYDKSQKELEQLVTVAWQNYWDEIQMTKEHLTSDIWELKYVTPLIIVSHYIPSSTYIKRSPPSVTTAQVNKHEVLIRSSDGELICGGFSRWQWIISGVRWCLLTRTAFTGWTFQWCFHGLKIPASMSRPASVPVPLALQHLGLTQSRCRVIWAWRFKGYTLVFDRKISKAPDTFLQRPLSWVPFRIIWDCF